MADGYASLCDTHVGMRLLMYFQCSVWLDAPLLCFWRLSCWHSTNIPRTGAAIVLPCSSSSYTLACMSYPCMLAGCILMVPSYASCLDASTYVYASEIWPTHLRGRGMAISTSGLFVSSLILLCAASDAFAAIGWKYYLVFLFMTILGAVVFAIFCPEVNPNGDLPRVIG